MSKVTKYKPAITLTGRIRQWFLHRVIGYDGESCDKCGRGYARTGPWWCEDDEWWADAYEVATGIVATWTPEGYRGLLCPRCFDRASRVLGHRVQWVPRILISDPPPRDLTKDVDLLALAKDHGEVHWILDRFPVEDDLHRAIVTLRTLFPDSDLRLEPEYDIDGPRVDILIHGYSKREDALLDAFYDYLGWDFPVVVDTRP